MAVLKSCCCFTNVRSGSIGCGVYSLVLSMISAGIMAYNLHFYEMMDTSAPSYIINDLNAYQMQNSSVNLDYVPVINNSLIDEVTGFDNDAHLKVIQIIFMCALVVACLLFVVSIFLVIGVVLDKHILFVPWIAVMTFNIVLDTGSMTYHTTLIGSLKFIMIEMVIWLLLTVLNIYCLLCVYSQHQELKNGRGTRAYLEQNTIRMSYHPGIQQLHINQGPIIINGALPQSITSTVQASAQPRIVGNAQVTTTLLVSAPDYNIAAGQLPQYHETDSCAESYKDCLILPPSSPSGSSPSCDSPPPPYSS